MDPERRHAIEVRFLGRVTWMLLAGALVVGWAIPIGPPRVLFVALLVALVTGLNVPAVRVVRRAVREGAPAHLVRALWVPIVLRGVATAVTGGLFL